MSGSEQLKSTIREWMHLIQLTAADIVRSIRHVRRSCIVYPCVSQLNTRSFFRINEKYGQQRFNRYATTAKFSFQSNTKLIFNVILHILHFVSVSESVRWRTESVYLGIERSLNCKGIFYDDTNIEYVFVYEYVLFIYSWHFIRKHFNLNIFKELI